jgi:hypothetical protein
MTLTIIFALNLGLFFWTYGDVGGCSVCSPMLNITAGIMNGNYGINWTSMLAQGGKVILTATAISGIILLISWALSGASGGLTGATSQANPLVVIGLAFFIVFAAIPNFSAMGLPDILDFAIRAILGFMAMLGVLGIMRGNE